MEGAADIPHASFPQVRDSSTGTNNYSSIYDRLRMLDSRQLITSIPRLANNRVIHTTDSISAL
ncbi:MAG TPA: hypothetical protein ACFCUC_15415 [Desulfobacterales bacterium]